MTDTHNPFAAMLQGAPVSPPSSVAPPAQGQKIQRPQLSGNEGDFVWDMYEQGLAETPYRVPSGWMAKRIVNPSAAAPPQDLSPQALSNLEDQKLTYTGGTNPILGQPTSGGTLGEQPASNIDDPSAAPVDPNNPNLYSPTYTTPFEDMLAEEEARKKKEKEEEKAALHEGERQQGWGY